MLPVMAQSNQQDRWESSSLTSREPTSYMWGMNSRPIKFITYHRDSKETGIQRSSLSPGFYYLSHGSIRRFQAWDPHGLFDSYSSLPWSGPCLWSLTQSLYLLWLSFLLALVPLSLHLFLMFIMCIWNQSSDPRRERLPGRDSIMKSTVPSVPRYLQYTKNADNISYVYLKSKFPVTLLGPQWGDCFFSSL